MKRWILKDPSTSYMMNKDGTWNGSKRASEKWNVFSVFMFEAVMNVDVEGDACAVIVMGFLFTFPRDL